MSNRVIERHALSFPRPSASLQVTLSPSAGGLPLLLASNKTPGGSGNGPECARREWVCFQAQTTILHCTLRPLTLLLALVTIGTQEVSQEVSQEARNDACLFSCLPTSWELPLCAFATLPVIHPARVEHNSHAEQRDARRLRWE